MMTHNSCENENNNKGKNRVSFPPLPAVTRPRVIHAKTCLNYLPDLSYCQRSDKRREELVKIGKRKGGRSLLTLTSAE